MRLCIYGSTSLGATAAVIALAGELDLANAPTLERAIEAIGERRIALWVGSGCTLHDLPQASRVYSASAAKGVGGD